MNTKEMTTTALIETFASNHNYLNDEKKTAIRNACKSELEKRFQKEFVISEYGEIANMTEDDVRQTEAYKYAYDDISNMDWSYSDWSMNYCILDDYFDERDIVSDVCDSTMIPQEVVWIAFNDFKKDNPQYIELAEKYVENDCEPIEEEFDE